MTSVNPFRIRTSAPPRAVKASQMRSHDLAQLQYDNRTQLKKCPVCRFHKSFCDHCCADCAKYYVLDGRTGRMKRRKVKRKST